MRAAHGDRLIGILLLVFGAVWTMVVYMTVPPGFGDGVGPRAFPLFLGIVLVVLSVLLLLSGARRTQADAGERDQDEPDEVAGRTTWTDARMVGSVFAIIVAYGFLMQKVGFEIATLAIVTTTMWLVLGIRKPLVIAATAIGLTFGCWLLFGQLLGAYLPPGTWLSFL